MSDEGRALHGVCMQVFESFMSMVHMAVSVDVPVEKVPHSNTPDPEFSNSKRKSWCSLPG